MFAQVPRNLVGPCQARFQNDPRLGCHQAIGLTDPQHATLLHIRVFIQAPLDLKRINPLPADLDEIIRAAIEMVETLFITGEPVARVYPVTTHGLGGLFGLVPERRLESPRTHMVPASPGATGSPSISRNSTS